MLAVKPPVARSENIRLIRFREDKQPNRRIAMAWRRSSAMTAFLEQLSQIFKELPDSLFTLDQPASGPKAVAA